MTTTVLSSTTHGSTAGGPAEPGGPQTPGAPGAPGAPDRWAGLWAPSLTLWRRDMVRFFRQRNRVIGALATPIVFWLVLGSGLGSSFALPGAEPADDAGAAAINYLEYFFPGTVILILLFSAIFSTITVIEDRREGFLQGVLVAPIPRLSIVLGKVFGGASIAWLQGLLFLVAWPWVGTWPGWLPMIAAAAVMFILAVGLTALGLCIAWPMDSTAGFHAVMNLFLIPMWLVSGAAFPIGGALLWMKIAMWCNPLTYGHAALGALLHGQWRGVGAPVPLLLSVPVTLAFAVALTFLATRIVMIRRKDGMA